MYIQPADTATTDRDLFCIFVFAQRDNILMQIQPEGASLLCFDLAETYHKFEMYKSWRHTIT